ncbi:hypothetical protein [Streptomyces sp. GESEQ-4]|uniref:hypothetical protein n=1 Tax=Streptomyces sp. GESEQ-4 TaxID=2812655 RepID=UPI001B33888E|nr:hypothetical protein [Streptomyces sp. GESEQ-4]
MLAFLMGSFAGGVLFTNCGTGMQRSVRPGHLGRGSVAQLVDELSWGGAGFWQLTVLPVLGLVGLALADSSRTAMPHRPGAD